MLVFSYLFGKFLCVLDLVAENTGMEEPQKFSHGDTEITASKRTEGA